MFKIENIGNRAKVQIMSNIGEGLFSEGFTLEKLRGQLLGLDVDEVELEINSKGGDALEALAIYDELRRLPSKVTTRYVGASASAATIIGSAADEREITENSRFLVHPVSTIAAGTAEKLKQTAEQMEEIDDQIINIYRRITGRSRNQLLKLMKEDKWLGAKEAKEWGFVTKVLKSEPILNIKENEMDNKVLELLNVKNEEQALPAIELLKEQLADYKAKVEAFEKQENERKEAEVMAFIDEQKAFGLNEQMLSALMNVATTDLETARKLSEGMKPAKISDVVDKKENKPEAVTQDQFYVNFKEGMYKEDKTLYREHFLQAFGKEPIN